MKKCYKCRGDDEKKNKGVTRAVQLVLFVNIEVDQDDYLSRGMC